ncbi:phosphoserine phosphatase SerB [Psychrobacter cryohalolentis]|uniref:Phosphoserine phosphatase n=1 Tax=Psychrobacter cryohalolentis (strain ATCC BAA-1226 / DSM 17306 / VKM B-2378 / K5) TaxID=335284 RepID=Q1Q8T0_PSYCK|nr:phosphoserine phosphatase SerB [Psychrobacter cryohalolentis]ABE75923.1 phosphoserine phosphatase [Psychrobacter cryohalolentis K5]ASE26104.1 phosphoserine phosphatase SerB [Psychrobacter cryohalolentis]
MPNNTSYSLPKDSKAWQQAVDSVASLLPEGTNLQDFDALQSLPIFALIVVLPTHVSSLDIHQYVQSWVDEQPNWHLVTVAEDADANFVDVEIADVDTAQPFAKRSFIDVQVFRYLLVPVTDTLMHPAKKTAAAHIIDDQLTTRLRRDLTEAYNNAQNAVASDHLDVVDCHILSVGHMLRTHKLACFDMDSTLIEQEVIVELAKTAGIGEQVEAITEAAMRGEMDFDESFAQRVALLQGIPTSVLDEICSRLTLSTGALATISALKALGYHTVLVSGGFTYFARYIAEQLGIDEVHANSLDIEEGEVTGHIQLPIVNGAKKAAIVAHTAERLGITMSQVVCVGDGANDLPMMALADLGVAFNAKPIVQARADAAVNVTGLEGVLYALGYPAFVRSSERSKV